MPTAHSSIDAEAHMVRHIILPHVHHSIKAILQAQAKRPYNVLVVVFILLARVSFCKLGAVSTHSLKAGCIDNHRNTAGSGHDCLDTHSGNFAITTQHHFAM